jgi:hypothetical protein
MTHRVWGGFHGKGGSPKQLFLNHPTDPTLTECWTPKHRIGNPYFEGQDTSSNVVVQVRIVMLLV